MGGQEVQMTTRFPQPIGIKGSLRWMQSLVNQHPSLLNAAVGSALSIAPDGIRWVSLLIFAEV